MRELIIGMGDLNGHVGRNIDGFQEVNGGSSVGKEIREGTMPLEFCDARHLCIANTLLQKTDKKI